MREVALKGWISQSSCIAVAEAEQPYLSAMYSLYTFFAITREKG